MANIAKRVAVGANIAIIVVAVMIGALYVSNYTGRPQAPGQISVGTKFALQDVNNFLREFWFTQPTRKNSGR